MEHINLERSFIYPVTDDSIKQSTLYADEQVDYQSNENELIAGIDDFVKTIKPLIVCSYNLGQTPEHDFGHLVRYVNPIFDVKTIELADYEKIQEITARILTEDENLADAYCLQEVLNKDRPFIQSLKQKGFKLIRYKESNDGLFDSAVALNKKRFKDIENLSIQGFRRDLGIALATDIQTNERIAFFSFHPRGFDYQQSPLNTTLGDKECEDAAKKLSEIENYHLQIVGIDMNSSPEKSDTRFKSFFSRGFSLFRTHLPTNVNPLDNVDQEREIDYILAKDNTSKMQDIASSIAERIRIKPFNGLGGMDSTNKFDQRSSWNPWNWNSQWNPSKNASDHLPIFAEVSPPSVEVIPFSNENGEGKD